MNEEQGLQEGSDILFDLVPVGLAAGIGGTVAKKFMANRAAKEAAAKAAASATRAAEGQAAVKALQETTKAKYPTLGDELAKTSIDVNTKSPYDVAREEIIGKGYDKMSYDDLAKARATLIGDKDIFKMSTGDTMHRFAIEDAMELAEKSERSQRASKGALTKADKKAMRREAEYDEYEDAWDYVDENSGKVYSDGMSREEFLEMDNPVFAQQWADAGYPTLPDEIVDKIAKGKLSGIPVRFRNKSNIQTAEDSGMSLGDILQQQYDLRK